MSESKKRQRQRPKYRPGHFCQVCNAPLTWSQTRPSRLQKGHGKHCSTKCSRSARKGLPIWRTCDECKAPYQARKDQLRIGEGKLCSTICAGRRLSKVRYGANGSRTEMACVICGEKKWIKRSRVERGRGKTCSTLCAGKLQSQTRLGDKSFNWQGGKSFEPYPPTFNKSFKRKIRTRDNQTCAICGKPGRCVHHINYVKDDTTPENCITLCRSCHSKTNANRNHWQAVLTEIMSQVSRSRVAMTG